jgi:hypothetical protein
MRGRRWWLRDDVVSATDDFDHGTVETIHALASSLTAVNIPPWAKEVSAVPLSCR